MLYCIFKTARLILPSDLKTDPLLLFTELCLSPVVILCIIRLLYNFLHHLFNIVIYFILLSYQANEPRLLFLYIIYINFNQSHQFIYIYYLFILLFVIII
jgi:hypothetical protein